jgi:hypothetical protein
MTTLWEDDKEEFRDIPDEAKLDSNGHYQQSAPVSVPSSTPRVIPQPAKRVEVQAADIDLEEVTNLDEDEDDFSAEINDANLRIEQGRLYQMIMKHDLFADMDADPRAVHNVTKKIRKFARESMEIMLGMRQEQSAQTNIACRCPFNDLEFDILKKIASKATNGATETEQANEVAIAIKAPPKRQTLTPISSGTPQPKKAPQKLQTKAAAPIQRKRLDATTEQILAEEGVSREEIEEHYKPIGKPLSELTPQELQQRQKETAARMAARKTVKSTSALPMATPEQQEQLALMHAQQIGRMPGMSALVEKARSMPASKTNNQ